MKYSLLLSFAFTTALLASTTSAGAIFSKSNPPAPIETVEVSSPTPARRPDLAYLTDEKFEALISGNCEALISGTKFTKNQWTEDEIQNETERRERWKEDKRVTSLYFKCFHESRRIAFIDGKIKDASLQMFFAFIDKQIEDASQQRFFEVTEFSIGMEDKFLLHFFLERGKSKLTPENYLGLVKKAFRYENQSITRKVLEHIDFSTVDLEDVIILALKSNYNRNEGTVDMLLAKKGPKFTGGKLLLAAVSQDLIEDKISLSGASVKLPRKEYDKDTYYDNGPAFMVRLLNEGDMDTKYDNYAALKHLIGKSKSEHLRYFLKAGKVDLSDVAKVEDAVILEKLDYLSKLVAEEPPAEYRELDDGFLYSNLEYDCGGVKPRYTGTNKWEMHYYAGAGAEAK